MLATRIAVALFGLVLAAVAITRGARRRPRRATVVELENETSVDPATEAVTSIQKADLSIDREALQEIWTPRHLERLARTYWRFLSRVTLGLIHVPYTEGERSVVFLARAAAAAHLPGPGIRDGRLPRAGPLGHLQGPAGLQAGARRRRLPADRGAPPAGGRRAGPRTRLHVEVAVVNFYPSIASGLSRTIYNITQSRIHVVVTYGFLRSLTRLDLAESRVGRLRDQ